MTSTRAAAHLATAIAAHVAQARRDGLDVPAEVIALGRVFEAAATTRHDPTPLDGCSCGREAEPVIEPELLTVPQVARVLGMSPRSVERRIASGALPSVDCAGVRVRRSDLARYIEELPTRGIPGASFRDSITSKAAPTDSAAATAAACAPAAATAIRPAGRFPIITATLQENRRGIAPLFPLTFRAAEATVTSVIPGLTMSSRGTSSDSGPQRHCALSSTSRPSPVRHRRSMS
jgi:Helix-turn-helix domain